MDMVNAPWLSLLIVPTLVCPAFRDPLLVITKGKPCRVPYHTTAYVAPCLPGGYCHRVYETHALPYFVQFPIVEMDRSSVAFWANRLYRSDFARYGDQWDAAARQSYATFVLGLQYGGIVPKSTFSHVSTRPTGPAQRLSPVRVINPFFNENTQHKPLEGKETEVLETSRVKVQTLTSSSVMPVRITNQFVP